jgi:hypothetical protein
MKRVMVWPTFVSDHVFPIRDPTVGGTPLRITASFTMPQVFRKVPICISLSFIYSEDENGVEEPTISMVTRENCMLRQPASKLDEFSGC